MSKKFQKGFAIVGADRVGKSTTIRTLTGLFSNKKYSIAHFSGPKPHHNSPIDQYTEVIDKAEGDILICDRFGSEVCFYEKFRRNYSISEEWAHAAESYATSLCEKFKILYISNTWENIVSRHEEEINKEYPNATLYYKKLQLEGRKVEHEAYQEYMDSYLTSRTLIDQKNIFKTYGEGSVMFGALANGSGEAFLS